MVFLFQAAKALMLMGVKWTSHDDLEYPDIFAIARGRVDLLDAFSKAGWRAKRLRDLMQAYLKASVGQHGDMMELLCRMVGHWGRTGTLQHTDEGIWLHVAVRKMPKELVLALVEGAGLNVNLADPRGLTPLLAAVRGSCFDPLTPAYLVAFCGARTSLLEKNELRELEGSMEQLQASQVGQAASFPSRVVHT
jgi:hypothetical protein